MAIAEDRTSIAAQNAYIRTSMKQPLLIKEDELALARAWREKGDEKALHKLVNASGHRHGLQVPPLRAADVRPYPRGQCRFDARRCAFRAG